MPIFLLWVDAAISSEEKLEHFQAVLTSTQLVVKGQTPLFGSGGHEADIDAAVAALLLSNTSHGSTTTPPTVFVTGWGLPITVAGLRSLCPATFVRHHLIHHRLMDMKVLWRFAQLWASHEHVLALQRSMDSVASSPSVIDRGMAVLRYFRENIFSAAAQQHITDRSQSSSDSAQDDAAKDEEGKADHSSVPPLLWLDLELTGLDAAHDRPLEISTLPTHSDTLEPQHEQVDVVLRVPLDFDAASMMDRWSYMHHTASGLMQAVYDPDIAVSMATAEERVLQTLDPHQPLYMAAGASVWFDLAILQRWMKRLAARLVPSEVFDTSVLLECCKWYCPFVYENRPQPLWPEHRTATDVQSSLALCVYLRNQLLQNEPYQEQQQSDEQEEEEDHRRLSPWQQPMHHQLTSHYYHRQQGWLAYYGPLCAYWPPPQAHVPFVFSDDDQFPPLSCSSFATTHSSSATTYSSSATTHSSASSSASSTTSSSSSCVSSSSSSTARRALYVPPPLRRMRQVTVNNSSPQTRK